MHRKCRKETIKPDKLTTLGQIVRTTKSQHKYVHYISNSIRSWIVQAFLNEFYNELLGKQITYFLIF